MFLFKLQGFYLAQIFSFKNADDANTENEFPAKIW